MARVHLEEGIRTYRRLHKVRNETSMETEYPLILSVIWEPVESRDRNSLVFDAPTYEVLDF